MNELEGLKQYEFEILRAFDSACRGMRLQYYLLGGTLLGAVRHKGFIPWDDDIDVGMQRADYEMFISQGKNMLPEYYFIQTNHSDPEWPANFCKIRDCRTTFIESSVKDRKINHGVYIVIFPLDYYPENEDAAKCFERQNRMMTRRISQVFSLPARNDGLLRRGVRSVLSLVARMKYKTVREALTAREALFRSVPQGNLLANYCGAWGKKEIVPSEWYSEGAALEFEGLMVHGPKEYDKWLMHVYGNYMRYPPVEKRVSHHYAEVIDSPA
jgi:lipopolysaccharide cholinephosphotransferase